MPLNSDGCEVNPSFFIKRKGVSIYRTYVDDDVGNGIDPYNFVCARAGIDHCSYFDVRDFDPPIDGPNLKDKPDSICPETMAQHGYTDVDKWQMSEQYLSLIKQWCQWRDEGLDWALWNHIAHAIDAGHLDQWREQEESKD